MVLTFSFASMVLAVTPNPGHSWSETGDGTFQVTGPTTLRTFTYPDADATVVTSNSFAQGDLIYGTGAGTSAQLPKDTNATRYLSNTGTDNNPAWSLVNLANGVSDILASLNGGTGNGFTKFTGPTTSEKSFTLPDASAKILTDNAAVSVSEGGTGLSTLTANNLLVGNNASAPTFIAPGAAGNYLESDGTSWVSTGPNTIKTLIPRPIQATGAQAAVAITSLTSRNVAMFNVPQQITINQFTYNIAAITTAGTYKLCVYTEDGATKKIDVTSNTNTVGVNNVAVGGVMLDPGNYYIAMGCATNCNNTVTLWTTTAATWINTTAVPTGKKILEGTVSMTSGTCNATLPTITGAISKMPVMRMDN